MYMFQIALLKKPIADFSRDIVTFILLIFEFLPFALFTLSYIVLFLVAEYMCIGFCSVE
jgi:hypothetical protein